MTVTNVDPSAALRLPARAYASRQAPALAGTSHELRTGEVMQTGCSWSDPGSTNDVKVVVELVERPLQGWVVADPRPYFDQLAAWSLDVMAMRHTPTTRILTHLLLVGQSRTAAGSLCLANPAGNGPMTSGATPLTEGSVPPSLHEYRFASRRGEEGVTAKNWCYRSYAFPESGGHVQGPGRQRRSSRLLRERCGDRDLLGGSRVRRALKPVVLMDCSAERI
jgi:hypothetical protein